jgi:hypothetical protein
MLTHLVFTSGQFFHIGYPKYHVALVREVVIAKV